MDIESEPTCWLDPLSQVMVSILSTFLMAGQIFQAVGSLLFLTAFVYPIGSRTKAGPRDTLWQEQRMWKDAPTLSSKVKT